MLFSETHLGTLKLKNRIVMPAMSTNLAAADGHLTKRQIAYYVERAKGGAGCLIFENSFVHQSGKTLPNMASLDNDVFIDGFSRMAEAVHAYDASLVVQLNHGGRQTSRDICRQQPVAPSPVPCPLIKEKPRALKINEIKDLVDCFARASERAQMAGCDGVEFHMAHGYLICQFLSPFSNHRTDQYGGVLENRARFALEILKYTRELVGSEFPLICRISADEMVEGGLTLDESKDIAQLLIAGGATAIHVSACNYASHMWNIPCYYIAEGAFLSLAKTIKAAIKAPVIVVGRILSAVKAEEILQKKTADLVAMGRALIADPYLPQKSLSARWEEIRPCLSCNRCFESIAKGRIVCAVNPDLGQEDNQSSPAAATKKVLVIGGGPAGLEAARQAGQRGHSIVLYEKRPQLGGQINEAARPPKKTIFKALIRYYECQLKKLGVKIKLAEECSLPKVRREKPAAVIMATGSMARSDLAISSTRIKVMVCEEALQVPENVGENVLIIGGGPRGAEIADFLSSLGKKVTVFEMKNKFGFGLPPSVRYHLVRRLEQNNVKLMGKTRVTAIHNEAVHLQDLKGREWEASGFNTIILSIGRNPVQDLLEDLKGLNLPVYVVGDACSVEGIREAVASGAEAARKL